MRGEVQGMKRLLILSFIAMLFLTFGCVSEQKMTIEQAREIALKSKCMDVGNLTSESFYNDNSKTWWFGLDMLKPGCSPACVVFENKSTEVNWRCTGLIPPGSEITYCNKPCHISIGQINYTQNLISCTGSNEPLMCTMEYRAGDICLKYLDCSIANGCKSKLDPKFYECIACFENETIEGPLFNSTCEEKYVE